MSGDAWAAVRAAIAQYAIVKAVAAKPEVDAKTGDAKTGDGGTSDGGADAAPATPEYTANPDPERPQWLVTCASVGDLTW